MATKTPIQTTAAPALSPARARLKEGLEAQQRARAIVDKAAKVVDAAHAAVERAREDAVKHDEMGADSVKERLALLKGEPAKSQDEIREARRNRLIAKEELTASDETLRAAQSELEEYRGNVLRGQKICNSHVTSVISESVTDVIAEWDKVNAERERLRAILDSLVVTRAPLDLLKPDQQHRVLHDAVVGAKLPWGDMQDWRRLMDKIGLALSHNYAQPDPGPGIARARGYWATFSDALLQDPSAEQPPLPTAAELFS
jgi:hypothetical protein